MSALPKELECPLCQDKFVNPKTLDCLHSFCLECLETLIERNPSSIKLGCPICRTPFELSAQQAPSLLTDSFLLNSLNTYNSLINSTPSERLMCLDGKNEATFYCFDCQEHFCDICASSHQKVKITKNHRMIPIDEIKDKGQIDSITKSIPQIYCQIHEGKEIELFCDGCTLPICALCVEQHPFHKILILSSNIGNEKKPIIDLINQVKPKEKELREGVKKCEEMIKQLEINSTTTQTQINQLFNEIRAKLDEKEQELLDKLVELEKYKKKELELQKEELEFGIESIIGSCQMIENSLSLPNNDIQLLLMKKSYCSRLSYLSNKKWRVEPCHHSLIGFTISKRDVELMYSNLSNVGIINSNDIWPKNCLILRNTKQRISENQEYVFEIVSYSKERIEIEKGGNGGRFKVQIEGESKENEYKLQDLNNGRYCVTLKIKTKGKYSIFVQYDGIDVFSSPFQLQVLPNQRNYEGIIQIKSAFGSSGTGNGQFSSPFGIAIDSNENIVVCDTSNNRIQTFNSDGKFISALGTEGNGNGQLKCSYGVAINSKGNIIATDYGNHRIQIFDSEGNFISKFGSQGNGSGQFNYPWGICVDMYDNIIVCDRSNHRIQKFDSEGNFILKFGSGGSANGQFSNPFGVASNSIGNIIVSDQSNNRIQIFDSEGQFISKFGINGNENGQFFNPYGICVDLNDNIFVCDYSNNRVQIFDSYGNFISKFGVNRATDLTIDPITQKIYICELNNKISVY